MKKYHFQRGLIKAVNETFDENNRSVGGTWVQVNYNQSTGEVWGDSRKHGEGYKIYDDQNIYSISMGYRCTRREIVNSLENSLRNKGKLAKKPEQKTPEPLVKNPYDVLNTITGLLSDEYHAEVTNGECPGGTIKVTKQGSTNAMYISLDADTVGIDAVVYEEPDGHHERDARPVVGGIYWDTTDESGAPDAIAAGIGQLL